MISELITYFERLNAAIMVTFQKGKNLSLHKLSSFYKYPVRTFFEGRNEDIDVNLRGLNVLF